MTNEELVQYAKNYAQKRIDTANNRIATFTNELLKNPADAFEWSAEEFAAAARHEAWSRVLAGLSRGNTLSEIHKTNESNLGKMARNPHKSTSFAANGMALCRMEAVGEVVDFFKDIEGLAE